MSMVEKIARAMAKLNNDYCEAGLLQWPAYEADARAALEALRVPSDEMVRAADDAVNIGAMPFETFPVTDFAEIWQAMLTAALGETE